MKIGRKLSLAVTLGVLLVTIPAISIIYILVKEHYLLSTTQSLRNSTQANIAVQISIIRRAENSLKTLAISLSKSLQAPPHNAEIVEFDRLTEKDQQGVIHSRRDLFDGKTQAGIFIPRGVTVTDKMKRIKLRAMKLLSSFGLAALQHYDGVWFDQLDKTSVIFWRRDPDFIYKLEPDHDYTQTLWDQLASPKLNPQRITLWTPAIYESPVNTWVVSAVHPLDIKGHWEGILGHDIALTELLEAFQASSYYQSSQHFLLDGFGNYILAGFWQDELENKGGEFKPDLTDYPQLKSLLDKKSVAQNQKQSVRLTIKGQDYMVFSILLDKLDWQYVRLIPVAKILQPVQKIFLIIIGLIIFSSLLIIVLINAHVRRLIVKPLLHLSKITYQYGQGNLQQRVQLSGKNEIALMGRTFNQMADNIADKQNKLIKSEARYRFILNSIHEAIILLDQKSTILFINPAFTSITGFSKLNCVGKSLFAMIYPDDREQLSNTLQQVWTEQIALGHLETRLKTLNQEYIWIKIAIKIARNEEGDKVLSTTSTDITSQKFTEQIDWILSESEKKILRFETLSHILTFICQELVKLFSFPLIWICLSEEDSALNIHACAGSQAESVQHWIGDNPQDPVIQAFSSGYLQTTGPGTSFFVDLSIPLFDGHKIIGVISFQFEDNIIPERAFKRLKKLAERISNTIQHAHNQYWLQIQNSAMETAVNAIFITNAKGYIVWANEAFSRLSGYQLIEIQGKTPGELISSQHQSKRFWQEFWQTLSDKKIWRGEITNQTKQGTEFIVYQSVTPIVDQDNKISHYITVQEDITDKKAVEQHIEHMATHDGLTDLANRVLLTEYLDICLARSHRQQEQVAVLFLDLDHFKLINDTQGHAEGDELLKQVATRLKNNVFDGDLVARLGGDEFVIILINATVQTVTLVARKILTSFKKSFLINDQERTITSSIGICLFPDDGKDSNTLLKNADTAMYYAKSMGKNNYQFFTETLNQQVVKRVQIEKDLTTALQKDEFSLVYQPQIDVVRGKMVGLEALIRWHHPEKGIISPADFISIAEETGLILPLGDWILSTACKQMQYWLNRGVDDLTVSVNLSARQFNDDRLSSKIKTTLEQSHLPARYLILELTESMMMSDINRHIRGLNELKQLGIKLSIDDFGTGYSSLSYLKHLPIDELKIDKSFIDDICHDRNDQNIVCSIIGLGHNLGFSVIAEGVEDQQQFDFLKQNQCDLIQGYFFSKPLTADQVMDFIQNNQSEVG